MRVTDYLIADHERLHGLLRAAAGEDRFDPDAFAAFRAGLMRHIAIEEKLLLTAAREARGGEPLARAHELRIDHAALGALLVPTPDLALCREIEALLSAHDPKEEGEGGVYAECERLWSPAESARLAALAAGFRDVRLSPHHDGPTVKRTAEGALASARRLTPAASSRPRDRQP